MRSVSTLSGGLETTTNHTNHTNHIQDTYGQSKDEDDEDMQRFTTAAAQRTLNRGTGAGGANTNAYGKQFEHSTDNGPRLLARGFGPMASVQVGTSQVGGAGKGVRKPAYTVLVGTSAEPLAHGHSDSDLKHVVFATQHGLKAYFRSYHPRPIEMVRCPDEAYLVSTQARRDLYILEKKEQRVEGSVETKLWSGPALKREYELVLGSEVNAVHYGYCVNAFLHQRLTSDKPKYRHLRTILGEHCIQVFNGDDPDYFAALHAWLGIPA